MNGILLLQGVECKWRSLELKPNQGKAYAHGPRSTLRMPGWEGPHSTFPPAEIQLHLDERAASPKGGYQLQPEPDRKPRKSTVGQNWNPGTVVTGKKDEMAPGENLVDALLIEGPLQV